MKLLSKLLICLGMITPMVSLKPVDFGFYSTKTEMFKQCTQLGLGVTALGTASYALSYLWAKMAKPTKQSTKTQNFGYNFVAKAIPLVTPPVFLYAFKQYNKVKDPWFPSCIVVVYGTVAAYLAAYPVAIIGSCLGESNAKVQHNEPIST